ncbi:MAG: (deoxy)nucleoside triphosphate pyrophosphohydrolase [Planctomycetota bacterium]
MADAKDPSINPGDCSTQRANAAQAPSDAAIRVAVGVLARPRNGVADGVPEVLIALRRADGVLGGLWEFPGGKLEPGESAEQALVRELNEELGITVRVFGRLTEVQHRYDHGTVWLEVFGCGLTEESEPSAGGGGSAEPMALAADEVRWVNASELRSATFPAANGPIVEAAVAWMNDGLGALPRAE